MPSYTTSLRLIQPATGEYSGTWGTQVNTGLTALVDTSVAGTATITMTAANYTLSTANGASDEARAAILSLGGTPGGSYQVIVPAVSKLYVVVNGTGFAQTVKTSGGTGITVPNGVTAYLRCDGTNVINAVSFFGDLTASSLTLTTPLAATSGGTGHNTYTVGDILYASTSTALSKLADVATGSALISGGVGVAPSWGKIGLTTHVTGTLPIANGGTGATATAYCSLTTNVSGILPIANGGTGTSSTTYCSLSTNVTGTLPVGNGGTGNATIAARSIFLANTANTLTTLTPAANQSIRINSGNTAWEAYTPAIGDVTLSANNAFTGANTFYNATGQTFGTATSTQDGIVIQGRAGGSTSLRVTLSPGTLTTSRSVTFPDAAGNVVIDAAANTFVNASGQTFLASATATQDGLVITGRAGGSTSLRVTLSPTTLTASRAVTFPDAAGAVVLDTATQTLTNKTLTSPTLSGPTINDGYTEEVFAVSGTTPALTPTNGSIQTWTLTGNSTPTSGTWADGQSLTLMVDDGTAYTITWSSLSVTWKTNLGSAPILNTSGFTVIQLWKVGSTIYGARVGDA